MMKKLLALVAAAILATGAAHAGKVQFNGDTMIVVEGGDTTSITGAQAKQRLAKILDDTVVGKGAKTDVSPDSDTPSDDVVELDRSDYNSLRWRAEQYGSARDKQESLIVISVVAILSLLVLIVAVSWIVANYKNRRNRYKMMEKAIENNYPLPAETNYVMGTPAVSCQPQHNKQPECGSSFTPNFALGVTNWSAFYRSFVLVVVGFALVMFFVLADVGQMAALSSIIMFVGLGKAFIIYQNQRNAMACGQQQMADKAGNAQQPSEAAQPAADQQKEKAQDQQ